MHICRAFNIKMNAKALLSPEQKENLVFKEMGREKNFAVVDDLKADFVFPKQKITVLFLALSFHEEHPHHIEGKITSVSKEDTNTKIVLLLLDKADTLNYVSEI